MERVDVLPRIRRWLFGFPRFPWDLARLKSLNAPVFSHGSESLRTVSDAASPCFRFRLLQHFFDDCFNDLASPWDGANLSMLNAPRCSSLSLRSQRIEATVYSIAAPLRFKQQSLMVVPTASPPFGM